MELFILEFTKRVENESNKSKDAPTFIDGACYAINIMTEVLLNAKNDSPQNEKKNPLSEKPRRVTRKRRDDVTPH